MYPRVGQQVLQGGGDCVVMCPFPEGKSAVPHQQYYFHPQLTQPNCTLGLAKTDGLGPSSLPSDTHLIMLGSLSLNQSASGHHLQHQIAPGWVNLVRQTGEDTP